MSKKEKIEQEINKTLEEFEKAEALPHNPYFYTRVKVRLDERRQKQAVFSVILRPVLLITLVVINLSTAVWYFSSGDETSQANTRQELLKVLSGDLMSDNSQHTLFFNQ